MERSSTIRLSTEKLPGTLVNPRADQADLFGREHLGIFAFGHEIVRIIANVRYGQDEVAVRAVTHSDHCAVPAAFHDTGTRVQSQTGFGLFCALAIVAFQAIGLKNRLDIGIKGYTCFGRSGRQSGRLGRGCVVVIGAGDGKSQRGGHGNGQDEFRGFHCLGSGF